MPTATATIHTLPCHKQNPIKIALKDGTTVIAKITRFDPLTGRVCWLSDAWKGTTHCSLVVKATVEEVADWKQKQTASFAPVDPIMAKWSLGKEKQGPLMMEGHYFESALLLNDVKVGIVCDEGNGGSMMVRGNQPGVSSAFDADCLAWAKANGAPYLGDAAAQFYAWWHDARPQGKDAKTYLAEHEAEIQRMLHGQKLTPATTSLLKPN